MNETEEIAPVMTEQVQTWWRSRGEAVVAVGRIYFTGTKIS
jgi:hypothetical protein